MPPVADIEERFLSPQAGQFIRMNRKTNTPACSARNDSPPRLGELADELRDGLRGKSGVEPPHSKAPASEGGRYKFKGKRAD